MMILFMHVYGTAQSGMHTKERSFSEREFVQTNTEISGWHTPQSQPSPELTTNNETTVSRTH
jgi:hypothetical protein